MKPETIFKNLRRLNRVRKVGLMADHIVVPAPAPAEAIPVMKWASDDDTVKGISTEVPEALTAVLTDQRQKLNAVHPSLPGSTLDKLADVLAELTLEERFDCFLRACWPAPSEDFKRAVIAYHAMENGPFPSHSNIDIDALWRAVKTTLKSKWKYRYLLEQLEEAEVAASLEEKAA